MQFSVTILGSSSALPTSERFPTAHLLIVNEHFFLIDCGEGTQMQLRKYRIRIGKINHIFISHLHGDHIFGLFGLISSFSLLGRTTPLHIYGTDLLEELVLDHLKYFKNELTFDIKFHRIQCGRSSRIFENKKVEVITLPLVHRVPTCGFLFKEKPKERNIRKEMITRYDLSIKEILRIKMGEDFKTSDGRIIPNKELTLPPPKPRSYAYCSDTLPTERILPLIKGADLFYHETTFSNVDKELARITLHSTAKEAAELAVKAGVKKLLIGHFSSRYKDIKQLESEAREVFSNTVAVNDGERYEIELTRE